MEYNFKRITNNETVKGKVVRISDKEIELDLNSYVSGIIFRSDFSYNDQDYLNVKIGDELEAVVKKVTNSDEQIAYLTRLPIIKKANFEKIKEMFENNVEFEPKFIKEVNGGAIYSYLGYEMFMPKSQTAKNYKSKIIDIKDLKIVISSKIVKDEIEKSLKDDEYNLIKTGEALKGKVIEIMPYGILVKLKNNVVLVRNTNLAYEFVKNPNELFKKNDEVDFMIIKKENGKLEGSIKALKESPFDIYVKSNPVSSTVKGKVIQKLPFGFLIELDNMVTGLLHESEYSWNPKSNFKDYVKLNDELELAIINIDKKKNKISLSKKALEDNPWKRVEAKKGDVCDCVITLINPGKGVNVSTLGIDAFININELSNEKISKIEDYFNVGDELKALVVDIDKNSWYINLSVKKYEEILEKQEYEKYMNDFKEEESSITLKDLFKDILK